MASVVLDRFSGGNPEGWILRAEQYFTYLGFLEKDWLPLASFYLDGAALDWFQWLYRNKQFFDWKHFTEKLALHFQNDSKLIHNHVNIALDLMRKLDENYSTMLHKLDNIQGALCACSPSVVADPVLPDADSSKDDKEDSDLPFDESALVFEDPVASDSYTVDECVKPSLQSCDDQGVKPSLQSCDDQTHRHVLLSDLTSALKDETLEEVSEIDACKVFAKIPDREIDFLEVADSVKHETRVFDKMFHPIPIFKCDSINLVMFDNMLLASPCMLSACGPGRGIFDYLSKLDHSNLPLSLYRFPLDQFILDFPFDPGSSLITAFLGAIRYCSIMVVDDVKEIIHILVCHIDSTSNDQFILSQFRFDPGANMFVVSQVTKEFTERSVWLLNPISPQESWMDPFSGRGYILPFDKMFLVPNKNIGWFDTGQSSSLRLLMGVVQRHLVYLATTPAATTVFVVRLASIMESSNSEPDQVFGAMSNGVCKVSNATSTSLLVGVLYETDKQIKTVQQCHFKDSADFLISFGSQESEMLVVRSARSPPARSFDSNSLYSDSTRWKTDFATFEDMHLDQIFMEPTLIEDLYLDKLVSETPGGAPLSEMHSDDLMIDVENAIINLGIGHAECILLCDPGLPLRKQGVPHTSGAKRKQEEFFSCLGRNSPANIFLVMIGRIVMINYIWDPGISCKTMNGNGLIETIATHLLLWSTDATSPISHCFYSTWK